jgi:hypothetical protein
MQIGDAAHGQTRQIGDQDAFIAGDCHWQRADGGWLIDDEQELAVGLEFGDVGAQFALIVWQRFVVQAFSGPIESDGVMLAFAYIHADEDIDGVMLLVFLRRRFCRLSGLACNIGRQVSASTLRTASRCSGRAPSMSRNLSRSLTNRLVSPRQDRSAPPQTSGAGWRARVIAPATLQAHSGRFPSLLATAVIRSMPLV